MKISKQMGRVRGTFMRCSTEGEVLEIFHDGLGLVKLLSPAAGLSQLVDEGSRSKLGRFFRLTCDQEAVIDWEVNAEVDGELQLLRLAGVYTGTEVLVMVALSDQGLSELVEEIAEINNEQSNIVRVALKENTLLKSKSGMDSQLFEEISQLNNQLINLQRELIKKNSALEKLNDQMSAEMNQARLAQLAFLPHEMPQLPSVRLVARYQPMVQIGGDFYDIFLEGDTLGLVVGDVTGHGIPAALLSFMFLTALRNHRRKTLQPREVIERSNAFLQGKLPDGKYATVSYCMYDTNSRILSYSSAGHPPGYLLRKNSGSIEHLQTPGTVVGMFADPAMSFSHASVELFPGDKVLLYTDGMMEVSNDTGQMIHAKQLETFLAIEMHRPVDILLNRIYDFCTDFAGRRGFNDDVTLLGMEVL